MNTAYVEVHPTEKIGWIARMETRDPKLAQEMCLFAAKALPWMDEHFPTLDYRIDIKADNANATITETFSHGRVIEGSRIWKWRRTGLRGWQKWEGVDK